MCRVYTEQSVLAMVSVMGVHGGAAVIEAEVTACVLRLEGDSSVRVLVRMEMGQLATLAVTAHVAVLVDPKPVMVVVVLECEHIATNVVELPSRQRSLIPRCEQICTYYIIIILYIPWPP